MKKRELIVVLSAVGLAGIVALALVGRSHPQSVKAPSSAPAAAVTAPPAPATVNRAEYNAKMLALANRKPLTDCAPAKAVSSRKPAHAKARRTAVTIKPAEYVKKKTLLPPCPAPLWPVHAALPDADAVLPFKRIVAYYGNFYSARMGILGEYPPAQVLAKLASQASAWASADPSTPVVPAIDYIVVSAQGLPGRDGMYRMRMPASQIKKAISMADSIHGLVFLDVQPGWSTVQKEVPRLEPYLKQANVELALDPEFALPEGKRPGAWRGTMSAADINFAARFLAKIVRENHLAPKVLVVHRFTQRMVTDYRAIKPLPQVEIVMDMDGFGSPALKVSTYKSFIATQPVQFTGFKLFYKNDVRIGGRLMAPSQVLKLSPQPSFILYQ